MHEHFYSSIFAKAEQHCYLVLSSTCSESQEKKSEHECSRKQASKRTLHAIGVQSQENMQACQLGVQEHQVAGCYRKCQCLSHFIDSAHRVLVAHSFKEVRTRGLKDWSNVGTLSWVLLTSAKRRHQGAVALAEQHSTKGS